MQTLNNETYKEMQQRHQKEVNEFEGMFFAFSNKQLKEGLEKVGLNENDTDKIYSIDGGGFIRKDRSEAFHAMFKRQREEAKALRKALKPIKIKFVGVDNWNRAVFKSIEKPFRFYGCTCTLFDYDATEKDVLDKLDEDALCYFGSSFGCEPMGTLSGNIKIIKEA